jgi:hypothetical protein
MTKLVENIELETYWVHFPDNPNMPFGIGVTASSEADAFALIRERGIDAWFAGAEVVKVIKGVRVWDLDQTNVVPNIGPMQFRGVWYPFQNVGWSAPKDGDFRRLT